MPSSTETLLQLGANVVACTKFCEQPRLTHVGGTKNPDVDAIVALAPDLVVVDREENRREDADALEAAGLQLFISDVTTLDDGCKIVSELGAQLGIRTDPVTVPRFELLGLRVFVPIWRRPWMSINAATYGGSLLAHLGCTLVTADLSDPYPTLTLDELPRLAPDVILVPTEPYEFSDVHLAELRTAAPESVVVRIDGQDLFWWGSRTPGAVERLAAAIAAVAGRDQVN